MTNYLLKFDMDSRICDIVLHLLLLFLRSLCKVIVWGLHAGNFGIVVVTVLVLHYTNGGKISNIRCTSVSHPHTFQPVIHSSFSICENLFHTFIFHCQINKNRYLSYLVAFYLVYNNLVAYFLLIA